MRADNNAKRKAVPAASPENLADGEARRLTERIKELECLYAIASVIEDPGLSFEQVLQGVTNTLPPAFQYPEITSARLGLDALVFSAGSLHRTRATLASPVKVNGKERGQIQVFYRQLRPAADEGPFLREERRLLDAVAERIGRVVERHEAEEALVRERRFVNEVFDVLRDIVVVIDPAGRMVRWNRMLRLSSGYSDREIAQMSAWDIFDPAFRQKGRSALAEAVLQGGARFDATMLTKDGTPVRLDFTAAALRNLRGDIVNICGVARDVTEKRRAEEELRVSEENFRTIFDSAGDAIFVTSLDGRILDANRAAEESYGYTREEMRGMWRGDFRADSDPVPEPLELGHLDEEWASPVEATHRRKDGSEFPVERARRLIEYSGQPAILAVIRDITERKKVQRALEESRAEYESIANLSGDIIFKADAAGRLTFVNDGACEFYGKSREELLGSYFRALRHPDDSAGSDALLENMRRERGFVHGYVNRHMSAQGWRTVQWNATALFGEQGTYEGFQATGRDVTDQVRIEEELRRLNAELEGFAHTVSHDLRGPLAAILLASEAFADFAESPAETGARDQMRRMTEVIRRNVERAKSLISDLITLARADRFRDETELLDIGAVVSSIMEERAAEISERGVQFRADTDLGELIATPTHMYQLFSNLIGNALKYGNGSGPLRVTLTHSGPDRAGHHYVLRDNGPGIPEEIAGKIFEPFVKGDEGSTGIGLAIVSKIVTAYGGDISVENDGGAVFRFNLHDAQLNSGDRSQN